MELNRFCIGCLACQSSQQCVLKDDAVEVAERVKFAGSLFCGGISDPGEADGKDTEKDEAYQFGKALE